MGSRANRGEVISEDGAFKIKVIGAFIQQSNTIIDAYSLCKPTALNGLLAAIENRVHERDFFGGKSGSSHGGIKSRQ